MAPQSFFGQMFGIITCYNKKFQDYSFTKNKTISVAKFLSDNQIQNQFHLPLSVQAFQEYQALHDLIQGIQVQLGGKDIWTYIWGNTRYTSSKFYHLPYRNVQPPQHFIWIWDSKCANKIRVFTWLLFMDRLNVRNILKRKKLKLKGNNYICVLCSKDREETTFHLFFTCPFSRECWRHLSIN
jgi:hypothetical protein